MIVLFFFISLILGTCSGYVDYEYPCDVTDIDCIRGYFSINAVNGCYPAPEPRLQELFIKYTEVFETQINSTVIRENTTSPSALDGKISTFFVDRGNNLTILAISYTDFIIDVAKATIIYYRSGLSPIQTSVSTSSTLGVFNITVYFNGADFIDLRDSLSLVSLGGNLTSESTPLDDSSDDPAFAPVFDAIYANYGLTTRIRLAPPQGSPYSIFYIQNKICNFGIEVPDRVIS